MNDSKVKLSPLPKSDGLAFMFRLAILIAPRVIIMATSLVSFKVFLTRLRAIFSWFA